jgi:glycosyltransferase involved in cell wall biosynthesis
MSGKGASSPYVIVMVTSSYPRFPGDSVGTFMEPIAKSVAARGHEVHIVAPWHPLVTRAPQEDGLRFHFFKYAPVKSLNVFGYAAAMRADVSLRAAAYAAAPLAMLAGRRAARNVAGQYGASLMHGHWVVPGGAIAAAAAPSLPLVVSLHGSDVYVAETVGPVSRVARSVFRRARVITACSSDLARRGIALGADPGATLVVPYGVDGSRFHPDPVARAALRLRLRLADEAVLIVSAGRLVRKKGFEYLIDALAIVAGRAAVVLALAGDGDLNDELRGRARSAGLGERVRFLGNQTQDEVAGWLAAADIIAVPSVKDDSGNVDGLPNVVLESLASGTPLITTAAGGIGAVVESGRTALVVPERDASALAAAIQSLVLNREARERLGEEGRRLALERFGWAETARLLEGAYERALAK